MTKEEMVAALIENKATKWERDDEEYLLGLEEDRLEKMIPVENEEPDLEEAKKAKEKEAVENAAKKGAEGVTPKSEPKPEPKPKKSVEEKTAEFIENAPPDIQDLLSVGLAKQKREREELIESILKNESCKFSKEYLEARTSEELEGLAALAVKPEPVTPSVLNYAGAAGPSPTTNAPKVEPLGLPTFDFSKQAS
jgi:hypothetical protein